MNSRRLRVKNLVGSLLLVGFVVSWLNAIALPPQKASADQFATRRLQLSESLVGASSSYSLSFSGQSSGAISSIRLQLCTNDPFPGQPCAVPVGLDFTGAVLVSQTGMTSFTVSPATTSNALILTRAAPISTVPTTVNYVVTNVHNPANPGTLYGRLETFASNNATGPSSDSGGLAISYLQNSLNVQTYVPPYLLFCVANTIQAQDCDTAQGNYIDFGDFSPTKTSVGQTQMVVATNADFGFTVAMQGTTMTSGTNFIPGLSSPDVSRVGVSQFGLNLRANSTPPAGQEPQGLGLSAIVSNRYNQSNLYTFGSGDVLVQANDPDIAKYTVTYIANVDKTQAPGVYVSTLTYITTASF